MLVVQLIAKPDISQHRELRPAGVVLMQHVISSLNRLICRIFLIQKQRPLPRFFAVTHCGFGVVSPFTSACSSKAIVPSSVHLLTATTKHEVTLIPC